MDGGDIISRIRARLADFAGEGIKVAWVEVGEEVARSLGEAFVSPPEAVDGYPVLCNQYIPPHAITPVIAEDDPIVQQLPFRFRIQTG